MAKDESIATFEGDITDYTESRLFDGLVGTLKGLLKRKEALSHETRYAVLYLLYETGVQGRKSLVEATGKDEEGLEFHLKDLLRANLIAKVPVPEGLDGRLSFYRITPLGQHEIESDLRLIHDHNEAVQRFRCNKEIGDAAEFYAAAGIPESDSSAPEALSAHREQLRERAGRVIPIE